MSAFRLGSKLHFSTGSSKHVKLSLSFRIRLDLPAPYYSIYAYYYLPLARNLYVEFAIHHTHRVAQKVLQKPPYKASFIQHRYVTVTRFIYFFPFLQMDLVTRFDRVASGNIASLENLVVGKRYLITQAVRQTTQYGPTILVTLRDDPTNASIKVFLPKRFAEVFEDADIDSINEGVRHYHLISHGRTPNGRSFKLTLEQ